MPLGEGPKKLIKTNASTDMWDEKTRFTGSLKKSSERAHYSEQRDSNPRPTAPKAAALAKLRYAPN